MKYRSTRGGVTGFTFEQALLSGFTSDGGILVPESVPTLTKETLQQWSKLTYPQLVKAVICMFVEEEEIPKQDVEGIVDRALQRFDIPEIVRIEKLTQGLNILELFHGPTLAFKDLALSCVGQFLNYFLEKRQKHMTIVVGTSGDTGSAAIESVRGLKWVDMVVLLPKGRCSRVQELQMTTVIEDNIHVYRVEGSSDDLDVPIKNIFLDADFAQKHHLCSINSINWARILVQIAHYYYAYFQMQPDCQGEVEIVVPTGACGNVTSGLVAVKMGLPVKLTCAVNVNDIVARMVEDGDFSIEGECMPTISSAMDIQVPYNVERLLYLLSDMDVSRVKQLLDVFEDTGKVTIPTDIHNKMKEILKSYRVSDTNTRAAMQKCWADNKYLLCPHTAVAARYHYDTCDRAGNIPRVCVATASPAKFEEVVQSANLTPQPTKGIEALGSLPTKFEEMRKGEDWEKMLKDIIIKISQKVSDMK